MFPNRLGVTEIMILLNQAVKKLFMLGLSGQAELNGLELFHCGDNRRLVDIEFLNFFPFGLPTAGEGLPLSDMSLVTSSIALDWSRDERPYCRRRRRDDYLSWRHCTSLVSINCSTGWISKEMV
jgi:hypothetical protein